MGTVQIAVACKRAWHKSLALSPTSQIHGKGKAAIDSPRPLTVTDYITDSVTERLYVLSCSSLFLYLIAREIRLEQARWIVTSASTQSRLLWQTQPLLTASTWVFLHSVAFLSWITLTAW